MVTPVKTTFGPATPPSSSKSKKKARGKTRQIAVHIDEGAEMAVVDEANDREHAPALDHEVSKEHDEIEVPRTRTKKVSPFTAWQRTKPGVAARTASKGTKREREVDAPEAGDSGSGKRVRSGTIQQNSP